MLRVAAAHRTAAQRLPFGPARPADACCSVPWVLIVTPCPHLPPRSQGRRARQLRRGRAPEESAGGGRQVWPLRGLGQHRRQQGAHERSGALCGARRRAGSRRGGPACARPVERERHFGQTRAVMGVHMVKAARMGPKGGGARARAAVSCMRSGVNKNRASMARSCHPIRAGGVAWGPGAAPSHARGAPLPGRQPAGAKTPVPHPPQVKQLREEHGLNRLTPPKEKSELVKFLLQARGQRGRGALALLSVGRRRPPSLAGTPWLHCAAGRMGGPVVGRAAAMHALSCMRGRTAGDTSMRPAPHKNLPRARPLVPRSSPTR